MGLCCVRSIRYLDLPNDVSIHSDIFTFARSLRQLKSYDYGRLPVIRVACI
jgi:hypothetical protein